MNTNVFGVMRTTEALVSSMVSSVVTDGSAHFTCLQIRSQRLMRICCADRNQVPSLLLSRSPRLVVISGIFGSITNQTRVGEPSPDVSGRSGSGGYFVYRSSKAALNMVSKLLDVELAPAGVRSVVLHPGGVQTRLTHKMGAYLMPHASTINGTYCVTLMVPK
jgi:NAD(P)-dependent dehydrogenase (short-subunit alcohol dehydrogenase family)